MPDVLPFDLNRQTADCPKPPLPGTRLHFAVCFGNSGENLANPDPTVTVRWGDQIWNGKLIDADKDRVLTVKELARRARSSRRSDG